MIATRVGVVVALATLMSVVNSARAQPVTGIVSSSELGERVGVWAKAREGYYSTYYGRSVSITVTRDATEFVVKGYRERNLPEDAVSLDKAVLRAVILADLEVLLNRSLFEAISAQHQTILRWLATVAKVQIETKDVEAAVKAENCNIIPCNPNACDPKTCSKKSVQRFLPPPPPPKR